MVSKRLRGVGKKVILVGGCFDLLHIGHLTFLEKAKKKGDVLFVLLESDANITKTKGPGRPINSQTDRAKILSALETVDYIIKLAPFLKNEDYDELITKLRPTVIATTKGDVNRLHKERQANVIGGKVIDVTVPVKNQSTTKLISLLNEL